MGVKHHIALQKLNHLFPSYNFHTLIPTKDGVIDTTYIVATPRSSYILKHFDRDIEQKIVFDKQLLALLSQNKCNTPIYIDENQGWYLLKKLQGKQIKTIQLHHIRSLARFMAHYHSVTCNNCTQKHFFDNHPIETYLKHIKKKFYPYYKKLYPLVYRNNGCDGFIHGDIFIDNTIFDGAKIGVFDFIDGGSGSFSFDVAVALLSFNPKNKKLFFNIFVATYNQHAVKKLTPKEIQAQTKTAKELYALLRLQRGDIRGAKQLIFR